MKFLIKYDLIKNDAQIIKQLDDCDKKEDDISKEILDYFAILNAMEIDNIGQILCEGSYFMASGNNRYKLFESINTGIIFDNFYTTLKAYLFECEIKDIDSDVLRPSVARTLKGGDLSPPILRRTVRVCCEADEPILKIPVKSDPIDIPKNNNAVNIAERKSQRGIKR